MGIVYSGIGGFGISFLDGWNSGTSPDSGRNIWGFPARHGGIPIAGWFIS